MNPAYFLGLIQSLTGSVVEDATNTSTNNSSDCPNGNQAIWNTFSQCIETPLQWVSFAVGMLSIAMWLCVLLPQIYENYKDILCVASISPGLLFSWIFGDGTNLAGAFLTQQGLVQVLLGVWFVMTDLMLMGQLIYYHIVAKRREKRANADSGSHNRAVLCLMGMLCLTPAMSGAYSQLHPDPVLRPGYGRRLLSTDLEVGHPFFTSTTVIVGYAIGIVSSIAYFTSRSFQIYKNFKYRNVRGLSTVTFAMAVLGNVFYGLAIVLYSVEQHYLLMHAPWLLGSWGVMFMDFYIVYQIKSYGKDYLNLTIIVEEPSDEQSPLIKTINSSDTDYGSGSSGHVNA